MKFPTYLSIGIVPFPGIITVNKTADGELRITGGSEGKLIEAMAQSLKFSYKLIPPPDGYWGDLQNGTWTGVIGTTYREETDIAVSKVGVSELRSMYIDYSYPYSVEDLTYATRKPGLRPDVDALIHPFTYQIWIMIALALVVMPVLFSIFFHENIAKSTEKVFRILTNQSCKLNAKNLKTKFMLFAWILGAMFLSYSYVAVLLSFLTFPLMEQGAENIEQLSQAVAAGKFKAMTYRGSMQLADLLDSKLESVRIIANHIKDNDNLIAPNRNLIVAALRKERIAMISPKDILVFFVQSGFFISKDSFKFHPSAIAMSHKFCCRIEVDEFVHRLAASGLYQKFMADDIFQAGLQSKSLDNDDSIEIARSLTVSDISGAFVILVMGYILSIFVSVTEVIHYKYFS